MDFKKTLCIFALAQTIIMLPAYSKGKLDDYTIPANFPKKYTKEYIEGIIPVYKSTGKDPLIYVALDMLKGTNGEFSRNAILGNNLSQRAVKIEFKDLAEINPEYKSFDALGWKKGKNLFIYINPRHKDAPPGAIAALLSHEALHQDEYNSLAEETYAWTLEAAVWTQLTEENPALEKISHPLVERENVIKQLFVRGDYTSKYIYKFVVTNKGYQNLPERSYGFEELL